MPTVILALVCVLSLLSTVGTLGLAIAAAADPEGRGGDYAMWGLIGASVSVAVAVVTGVMAVVRWLS